MPLFIILAAMIAAASPLDCDFSIDGATPPAVSGEVELFSTGNDTNRQYRALLPSGEYLVVKFSACVHFGMTATLVFPDSLIDPKETRHWNEVEIRKRLLLLGKSVLWKKEFALFQQAVANVGDIGAVERIDVAHDYFSEFYFTIETSGSVRVLTVAYWFS